MIGVFTYLAYLAITVPMTAWVAGLLTRSARVLLEDAFPDDDLAEAVTRLLVMGFSLLGLGAVLLLMRGGAEPVTAQDVLAVLSVKVGAVALLLGLLHLVEVAVLGAICGHDRRPRPGALPMRPSPTTLDAPFPAPPAVGPFAGRRR